MKPGLLLSLLTLCLIACNTNTDNSNKYKSHLFYSKGQKINPDSIEALKSVLAGPPLVKKAGVPDITVLDSSVHNGIVPEIIDAGIPRVITPGTDTFQLPKYILPKIKLRPVGIPEVTFVKEGSAKDKNPGNFSYWGTLHGLKNTTIRSLAQDRSGNIWIGTNGGGISRYDGKYFTTFTTQEGLSNNIVLSILADHKGNLWFGTNGGLSLYDGKTFTNFTIKDGLPGNEVNALMEDKSGNIWFGIGGGGICCYNPNSEKGKKSFLTFNKGQGLPASQVTAMIQDRKGNIWIGTETKGFSVYNGKSFQNYNIPEGLIGSNIRSVKEDRSGNIWIGTPHGVSCFSASTNAVSPDSGQREKHTFTNYKNVGQESTTIWDILEDKQGNIWFSTNSGVSRFDLHHTHSFTSFTENDGLPHNRVWCMLEDRSGDIWMGTDGAGLALFNGKVFTSYSKKDGLIYNTVSCILEHKSGELVLGYYLNCFSFFNGKSLTTYTDEKGMPSHYVLSAAETKSGDLWFGTFGEGVVRYDGQSFIQYNKKQGLVGSSVFSVKEDHEGNMWFGTDLGASCLSPSGYFTTYSDKQGLCKARIYAIQEDRKGNIWFGTNGSCVIRLSKEKNSGSAEKATLTQFNEKDGLANNTVFSILEDSDGNLWFGTDGGGVSRYDSREEARGHAIINFTTKDGLLNNTVVSLLEDKNKNLWFGTPKGLSKATQSGIQQSVIGLSSPVPTYDPVKEALFYNYSYADGFLGIGCRRNSFFQDSKGIIWCGADMLLRYNPAGEETDTFPPVLNLSSIKLYGESVPWSNLGAVFTDSTGKEIVKGVCRDTLLGNGILLKDIRYRSLSSWYGTPEQLSLPYNNNNLTFSFIGIHMKSRNHMRYQYKMEGVDPDWSSITDRTEAPYGNLPSGSYIFRVKAMNQSGKWSVPIEYHFEVRPPWWQTWWFRGFVVCLIIGSVWFYIKWREKNLKREKELLEEKVDVRTKQLNEQKEIADSRRIIAEEQKGIIAHQKQIVEEKHREITDSINYAERIQKSFLATKELLDTNLREYFVYFQPKDVVSGDFYWASVLNNGHFALATADSTGHGVPGAIMSILNISCLENAIGEYNLACPSEILNHTRSKIIERLKKDGSPEGGKDGMDCSLISFDFEKNTLCYSAANNPIWIVRDQSLMEFAPDKMPVGKHDRDTVSFTQHTIELKKNDVVYAITDGFPDQFGGPKGKKYMYKQLKELLISIAHLPMAEQKKVLAHSLNTWKGRLEQIDDITVVGVRV